MYSLSKSNSGEGSKCDGDNENLPKVNWTQHASALDNFSSQKKFLSSNFLLSLETQKPQTMAMRYINIIFVIVCFYIYIF